MIHVQSRNQRGGLWSAAFLFAQNSETQILLTPTCPLLHDNVAFDQTIRPNASRGLEVKVKSG